VWIPINGIYDDAYSVDFEDNQRDFYEPCPTCLPDNPHGYICPIPVPTAPGRQIPRHFQVPGHVECGFCAALVPLRAIPEEKCASCNAYSCHAIDTMAECPHSILVTFEGLLLSPCIRKID
jgi:hypothetical protein